MRKICDWICLVIWVVQFIFAILACCGVMTIHPLAFLCAVGICMAHYVENLLNDYIKE